LLKFYEILDFQVTLNDNRYDENPSLGFTV